LLGHGSAGSCSGRLSGCATPGRRRSLSGGLFQKTYVAAFVYDVADPANTVPAGSLAPAAQGVILTLRVTTTNT
jgi:hypothetical protein